MNQKNLFFSSLDKKRSFWAVSIFLVVVALVMSACTGYAAPQQTSGVGLPSTGATATSVSPAGSTGPTDQPANEMPTSQPTGNIQAMQHGAKAYIGLFKENAVAVLDTATNQVLAKIPVPAGPHGLVITPDGRRVYVSSDGDSKVSVIDTSTDRVVDTIEVGKSPHGLAISPDGQLVLVAVFGTDQVVFIYTPVDAVIGQEPVPGPHNIAISPDGRTAYVAAQKQGSTGLAILDIGTASKTGFIPLEKAPRALNFSPDGKKIYFTQAGVDAVEVLDPAINKVVSQIPVGASPHHPLFSADGEAAFVVSQGPGQLSILYPEENQVTKVVPVGKMPHWIAVNPQGTTAWVTNEASNDVSVVDIASGKVTATIPVGKAPRKIVVQPQVPAEAQQPGSNPAAFLTTIKAMAFSDQNIEIKAGGQITWTNNDSIIHTVTSDQNAWDSGELASGQSFTLTLKQPGRYSYHCSIHPNMTGTILVTP